MDNLPKITHIKTAFLANLALINGPEALTQSPGLFASKALAEVRLNEQQGATELLFYKGAVSALNEGAEWSGYRKDLELKKTFGVIARMTQAFFRSVNLDALDDAMIASGLGIDMGPFTSSTTFQAVVERRWINSCHAVEYVFSYKDRWNTHEMALSRVKDTPAPSLFEVNTSN